MNSAYFLVMLPRHERLVLHRICGSHDHKLLVALLVEFILEISPRSAVDSRFDIVQGLVAALHCLPEEICALLEASVDDRSSRKLSHSQSALARARIIRERIDRIRTNGLNPYVLESLRGLNSTGPTKGFVQTLLGLLENRVVLDFKKCAQLLNESSVINLSELSYLGTNLETTIRGFLERSFAQIPVSILRTALQSQIPYLDATIRAKFITYSDRYNPAPTIPPVSPHWVNILRFLSLDDVYNSFSYVSSGFLLLTHSPRFLHTVTEFSFSQAMRSHFSTRILPMLTNVTHVDISAFRGDRSQILEAFCENPRLISLDISGTLASIPCLPSLLSNSPLQSLNLSSCKISKNLLHQLPASLRHLDLSSCDISDVSVQALDNLPALEFLSIANTKRSIWVDRITDAALEEISQHCRCLVSVDLSCRTKFSFGLLSLTLANARLQYLNLSGVNSLTDDIVLDMLPNCGSIRSLCLSNCTLLTDASISSIPLHCQSITSLNLSGLSKLTDSSIQNLTLKHLRITDLDIVDAYRVSDSIICTLCDRSRFLQSFKCHKMSNKSLSSLTKRNRDLSKLVIADGSSLSSLGYRSLSVNSSNLTHLEIVYPRALDDDSLNLISTSKFASKLISLKLLETSGISEDGVCFLASSFPSLISLDVSGWRIGMEELFLILASRFRLTLQELRFSNSNWLDDMAVNLIANSFPSLRVLDISRCTEVTDAGISSLTSCKNLQSVVLTRTNVSGQGLRTLRPIMHDLEEIHCAKYPNISSSHLLWVEKEFPHINIIRYDQ